MANVINHLVKTNIDFNATYQSTRCSTFKILGLVNNVTRASDNAPYYMVKFDLTGYECMVTIDSIRYGTIRDPYYPSVFGVGCCGITNIATNPDGSSTREYALWHGMMARCYNPNDSTYKYYGAKGVIVSPRWLCFEYFANDLPLIPGYELWKNSTIPREYQLEKDYKQLNSTECKIYSLETCYFASQYSNKMIKSVSNADSYSSKYIGVNRVEYENGVVRYESYIWVNNKKIGLGYYMSEDAAAQARDSAALQFYCNDVILNNAPGLSSFDMDLSCTSRKDCSKYYLRPMIDNINDKKDGE